MSDLLIWGGAILTFAGLWRWWLAPIGVVSLAAGLVLLHRKRSGHSV